MSAPSKEACQIFLSANATKAKLIEACQSVTDSLSAKRKIKQDLKFGNIDLRAIPGKDDVISTAKMAESAADDVSKHFLGNVSKSSKELFKSVYMQIIKLILSTPESAFSLVCVPRELAISYSNKEVKYLSLAKQNIDIISSIVFRWATVPVDYSTYYSAIMAAIPYIKDALSIVKQVNKDINNVDNTSFQNALAFNQNEYNRVKEDIFKALEVLKTAPTINDPVGVAASLISGPSDSAKAKIAVVEKRYKTNKQSITDRYLIALAKASKSKSGDSSIRADYAEDMRQLDETKNRDISNIKKNDSSNYRKKIQSTGTEFVHDAQELTRNLLDLTVNLEEAYRCYTNKQILCYNIYTIDAKIKNLIHEILGMVKPGSAPTEDISQTEVYLSISLDKANSVIDKKVSPVQMSTTKQLVDSFLKMADESLSVTLANGLKGSMQQSLQSSSGSFNYFIKRIFDIQDWDGQRGVWAVRPSLVAPPHIQAMASSVDCITQIPEVFGSAVIGKSNQARNDVIKIRSSIDRMINHNSYVANVLKSYRPPAYSELAGLVSSLNSCDMLTVFAQSMSINAVLSAVQGNTSAIPMGSEWPGYRSCMIYPELYKDKSLVTGTVKSMLDVPAYGTDVKTIADVESNSLKVQTLKEEVRSYQDA